MFKLRFLFFTSYNKERLIKKTAFLNLLVNLLIEIVNRLKNLWDY